MSPKLPALTGAEPIAVPVHGKTSVKRGTLGAILRDAGIGREELQRLLDR